MTRDDVLFILFAVGAAGGAFWGGFAASEKSPAEKPIEQTQTVSPRDSHGEISLDGPAPTLADLTAKYVPTIGASALKPSRPPKDRPKPYNLSPPDMDALGAGETVLLADGTEETVENVVKNGDCWVVEMRSRTICYNRAGAVDGEGYAQDRIMGVKR